MKNCIAIDDEPIALSILNEHCSRYGDIRLECFTSPIEGMNRVSETNPDIVFLDIEMTSHNGIELAKKLPEGTVLIFTTAYSQYALEGFNLNAVDFLHKPIFYPRFLQAIEKANAWLGKKDESVACRGTMTLKSEHKNVIVELESIRYIEAMDNYVKVYRKDGPTVISQITMKELVTNLPVDKFIRVHRSYIVPLEAIDKFSNRKLYIKGVSSPIPVGRTYNEVFQNLYSVFKLKNTDRLENKQ